MATSKKVIPPSDIIKKETISDKVSGTRDPEILIVDFSKFKIEPICLRGRFNNHFKDIQHFASVASNFIGTILPKITSHTYDEIREGGAEGRILHFHTIDEEHRKIVREILEEYHFPKQTIEQMIEGNHLFDFSAALGHMYPARIVCHKVDNILHLLFFDTNHHVYINEKYIGESLFYEDCPQYKNSNCIYMPQDCFAVGCLDEEKIRESMGYSHTQ